MEKKVNAEKTLKGVATWYNNLTKEMKKETTCFAIIGDMKNGINHQLLVGDCTDLVMTLAQTMVGDERVKDVVKEAVALAERYEKCKEIKELGFRQDEKAS